MLKAATVFVSVLVLPCTIAQDVELEAIDYLTEYGYFETNDGTKPVVDETALSSAVKKFQEFAGLRQTGILDQETQKLMKTPRCGMDDRVADFVLGRTSWKKKELTYRIFTYPTNGLSRQDVDSETVKAFSMWQDNSGMSFSKRRSGPVDIEILFAKGSHGDRNPFDGPGGVLAHAYFPSQSAIGGDAHFDDSEDWSVTYNKGKQVLNTLTHEFGHSLGLRHSNVPGSIMAPFYKGWDKNLRLAQDDINGIQSLYGKRVTNIPPVNTTPKETTPVNTPTQRPPTEDKELCVSRIDAIVNTNGGTSYVFQGDEYYKLIDDNVAQGYPRKIAQYWPGLPDNIDASVTWKSRDITYFFKGDQYWRFAGVTPSSGYPKDISIWQGLPSNLDAAFQWGPNNHLYFLKGSQYWKYDTDQQTMVAGNPFDMSSWTGVPVDLDAAFQWKNGKTYIFKSGQYWRFNDESFRVDRSNPPFPRDAGVWWFGCPKKRLTIPSLDVSVGEVDTEPEDLL